jgi:alpha-amylase/alpha-mannosidase (GH57 family)
MTGTNLNHALGLHMHQPPGNLKLLLETNPGEAEQIIRCYDRSARYALKYRDLAHLHIGFSGVLLEQLLEADVVDAYRHIVDIPSMLGRYREAANIELVGVGYYHPIFPLVPKADWEEQLASGRAIMEEAFGRAPRGFWPPEMAFSMEMIPALVKAGYDYVVVDGVHVRPRDGLNDSYRPYLACHDGVCITVVPRDRDLSNAQASGLEPDWFTAELRRRVEGSPRPAAPRLITTWSDGENGAWFRQTNDESGFFGRFFAPCMERARAGELAAVPTSLSGYLERNPPTIRARVQTGAWNAGSTAKQEFSRWVGSQTQQQAAAIIRDLSRRYWSVKPHRSGLGNESREALDRARALILESQTSCFLFWGDAWIPRLYERTDPAARDLAQVEQELRVPGDSL